MGRNYVVDADQPDYVAESLRRQRALDEAEDERIRELVRAEVRLQLRDEFKQCESCGTVGVGFEGEVSEVVVPALPVEVPVLLKLLVGLRDVLGDLVQAFDADHVSSPVDDGSPNVSDGSA